MLNYIVITVQKEFYQLEETHKKKQGIHFIHFTFLSLRFIIYSDIFILFHVATDFIKMCVNVQKL